MNQPALSAAAIAAAMLLSVTASADASLIASLIQTSQPSVSLQSGREGISDWLNRLSHAAHQIQSAFNGDAPAPAAKVTHNAPVGQLWLADVSSRCPIVDAALPMQPPLREALLNLPPPTA